MQNDFIITGLTQNEVLEQKRLGKQNHKSKSKTKTTAQIFKDNICTLFNLIIFLLALLVMLVGSYRNALFSIIIVINIVIGIIQEIRAKKTVEKISLTIEPKAHIIRDGELKEYPIEEIVLGDLVCIFPGNQISADSVVVDGEIEVNEALLTGESDAIQKKVGDKLYSGSFVVAGEAKTQVENVGKDNYAETIVEEIKKFRKPNSQIMKALRSITRFSTMVVIPMGIALFFNSIVIQGIDIQTAVNTNVAALVGMIPEGLILLTSVALALGVIRLSQHKTLVQELYCIEALARVDTLCLDKTGTITEGDMSVTNIRVLGDQNFVDQGISGMINHLNDNNPTFQAIQKTIQVAPPNWDLDKKVPFSSSRKWSGTGFKGIGSFVLGAPEIVLKDQYTTYQAEVEKIAKTGGRALVFAFSSNMFGEDYVLPQNLEVLAFLTLGNKIRETAPDTLAYFEKQGVEIKIISGDNVITVSEVARQAGLKKYDNYIDVSTLSSDEAVAEAANSYTVFGRVTPEQKRILIKAIKAQGHTVAMTGDGVNDVLALHESDCSIAMANGSEATRQMAQLVLLDSNFSNLTDVVAEGRRVINNISRASSLFLVKTVFSMFLSFFVLVFSLQYPLVPIQLSLLATLTIGVPAFFLALEPNSKRITGEFLRTAIAKALPGGITNIVIMIIVIVMGNHVGLTQVEISTLVVVLCGFVGLAVLYYVSAPLDLYRGIVFGIMSFGFIISISVIPKFFLMVPFGAMPFEMIMMLICLSILIIPLLKLIKKGVILVGTKIFGKNFKKDLT